MEDDDHDAAFLSELSAMLTGDAVPSSLGDRQEDSAEVSVTIPAHGRPYPVKVKQELPDDSSSQFEAASYAQDDSTSAFTATANSTTECGMTDSSVAVSEGKKRYRQGRQKKAAELIDNHNRLHVAFCKRKDGAMKKAAELDVMTGCAILLVIQPAHNNVTPVSTYAYASSAWKTSFFGEGMRKLLNAPHAVRTTKTYKPTERHPENVLGSDYHQVCTHITDKLSDSRDEMCTIVHNSMRRCKTEEPSKSLQQYQFISAGLESLLGSLGDDGGEEEDDEEDEEEDYFDAQITRSQSGGLSSQQSKDSNSSSKSRKRSYTPDALIPNIITRSLCYSKRRFGLFKKIFELVALTDCRAIIASAWLPSTGETPLKYHVYASPEWRVSEGYTQFIQTLVSAQELEHYERARTTPIVHLQNPQVVAGEALSKFVGLLQHPEEFDAAMNVSFELDDYLLPPNAINVETPSMAQTKRMRKSAVVAAATKKGTKIKQTTWIKFLWVFPPKELADGTKAPHSVVALPKPRRANNTLRKQRASDRFKKELAVFIPETSDADAIPDTLVQHDESSVTLTAAVAGDVEEPEPATNAPVQQASKRHRVIGRSESADSEDRSPPAREIVIPTSMSETEIKAAYEALDVLIRIHENAFSMPRASLLSSTPPSVPSSPTPAVTKAPPIPRLLSSSSARTSVFHASVDSTSFKRKTADSSGAYRTDYSSSSSVATAAAVPVVGQRSQSRSSLMMLM